MRTIIPWLCCHNCWTIFRGVTVECPKCGAAAPYFAKDPK